MCLSSRNAIKLSGPSSRPSPDSFQPPNGACSGRIIDVDPDGAAVAATIARAIAMATLVELAPTGAAGPSMRIEASESRLGVDHDISDFEQAPAGGVARRAS